MSTTRTVPRRQGAPPVRPVIDGPGYVEHPGIPRGRLAALDAFHHGIALATAAVAASQSLAAVVAQVPPGRLHADALVSLRAASSDHGRGLVTLTHDALRHAQRRDPSFPAGQPGEGHEVLYPLAGLVAWHAARVAR